MGESPDQLGKAGRRLWSRGVRRRNPSSNISKITGWRVALIRFGLIVALLGVWEAGVAANRIDPFFFGRPSLVLTGLIRDLGTPPFWGHIAVTVQEAILGLALGVGVGCALGFVFARYRTMYQILDPIIYALYSLPRITLAPLFVLWFGIGTESKVALAFSIVFFIMLLNTYVGITTIDRDIVDAVRLMGAGTAFITRVVMIPGIVPWLIAAFRLSASYALLAAIVGEMIGANRGIGKLLVDRGHFLDINGIYGLLVVVGIFAIGINSITKLLEQRFSQWRSSTTW